MGLHPIQVEIFRRMDPVRKLEIAARLWTQAWELKYAYLRQLHPEWSDEEVNGKVREAFLHART